MKIFYSVLILFFSILSYAGTETGNGGQGVFCPQNQTVQLFDYYEAQTLRGVNYAHSGDLPFLDQAKSIIDMLISYDPVRSNLYQKRLISFLSETRFLKDSEFTPISDSNSIVLPKNCNLVQIAVQRPPRFPGEAYYFINKDYWEKMSEFDKAGLVLHEIMYRDAIMVGATDSAGVRYFNSSLASLKKELITLSVYNELLRSSQSLPLYTLYKSLKSGELWYRVPQSCVPANGDLEYRNCSNQKCSEMLLHGRAVEQIDITNGYPFLGEGLIENGILSSARNKLIFQIIVPPASHLVTRANVVLYGNKFEIDWLTSSGHLGPDQLGILCIAK